MLPQASSRSGRPTVRSAWVLSVALLIGSYCAAYAADLNITISRRIPCKGDTVKLGAYLDEWVKPAGDDTVVFSVGAGEEEQVIGKTVLSTDTGRPFEAFVEWSPRQSGQYRLQAVLESTGARTALLVPVVTQDVYFCWYGRTRDEVEWITHHLTAAESEIPRLHGRGIVALKAVGGVSYLGGPRWDEMPREVDFESLAPRVVRDYTEVDPWDGIAIDELGMWEQHPEQTQLALGFWPLLAEARKQRPDKFIAAWQFAALSPLVCNMFRDTVDLVMCEVYTNYFKAWYDQHTFHEYLKQRIDMARTMMVSKKTVIGLSISTDYGSSTPEEIEDHIRTIRTLGPEMRGLAFFTTSRCDEAVLRRANDCCYRYFVKPAVALFSEADLTLSDYQPDHHGMVRVHATVHNVGGMEARNVRVRFWDGDPANGGAQVGGTQVIPRLPAAEWVDPLARDQSSYEPAETMRRESFGMVTVSVPWRALAGPHELWAEIQPDPQYTTIRACQSRRISVR